MSRLEHLNQVEVKIATDILKACCGSTAWVKGMLTLRPFQDERQLYEAADRIWKELTAKDWLEAFASHPKIGDRTEGQSQHAKWSEQEQKGVADAAAQVLADLTSGNREYEKKFGMIFLVCATGKSAEDMLAQLRRRIQNTPQDELKIAAEEQAKITRIRLEKWLKS